MNKILQGQLGQERTDIKTVETTALVLLLGSICIDPNGPTEAEQKMIRQSVAELHKGKVLSEGAKEWWLALTGKAW